MARGSGLELGGGMRRAEQQAREQLARFGFGPAIDPAQPVGALGIGLQIAEIIAHVPPAHDPKSTEAQEGIASFREKRKPSWYPQ